MTKEQREDLGLEAAITILASYLRQRDGGTYDAFVATQLQELKDRWNKTDDAKHATDLAERCLTKPFMKAL